MVYSLSRLRRRPQNEDDLKNEDLSQAIKSECGMAQTSSCIAGFNVLNMRYVRTTAGNQDISQLKVKKFQISVCMRLGAILFSARG